MKGTVFNFYEHRHNFAVWTASRSVQRGFTTTKNISTAIEISGLRNFVETYNGIGKTEFEEFHVKCSQKIIEKLNQYKCTYGIAAKIIAIYIKTAIVIPLNGENCDFIHPPLDRILLKNFKKCNEIKSYEIKPWTKLDKTAYWDLISLIEKYEGNIVWKLERYWNPYNK